MLLHAFYGKGGGANLFRPSITTKSDFTSYRHFRMPVQKIKFHVAQKTFHLRLWSQAKNLKIFSHGVT